MICNPPESHYCGRCNVCRPPKVEVNHELGLNPDIMAQRAKRITRLIEEKFMTPEAAAIVVDAAMFGIGCTEGNVRLKQQALIDKGLPPVVDSQA